MMQVPDMAVTGVVGKRKSENPIIVEGNQFHRYTPYWAKSLTVIRKRKIAGLSSRGGEWREQQETQLRRNSFLCKKTD
jgi:hypothetical protein